jgi:hypothetical protein
MTKLFGAVQPHMEVVTSDGQHVGTVDHEDGEDLIKLTKADGAHRHIYWDWVARVDEGRLCLNVRLSQVEHAWRKAPAPLE